jgi:NADH dehydrogenase FAD-containing subunit
MQQLLPSTTVGTLEFRCIQEPIRTIDNLNYYQARLSKINKEKKTITCEDFARNQDVSQEHQLFDVEYDKLILAMGVRTNTFNTPGVEYKKNNVYFLKQLDHARAIRNRILECFERASVPGKAQDEIQRLLTFVIVGGGPTSVEFSSELHDFIRNDVTKYYPQIAPRLRIVLVEASDHIMGAFNESLVSYIEGLFKDRHIDLLTNTAIKEVREHEVELSCGDVIPCGMVVWSAGGPLIPVFV